MSPINESIAWNTSCASGWSNVGSLMYPPIDPEICFVFVLAIDIIYIASAIVSCFAFGMILKVPLSTRFDVLFVAGHLIVLTVSVPILVSRLYFSHDRHIRGMPEMDWVSKFWLSGQVFFWTSNYIFFWKYYQYTVSTANSQLHVSTPKTVRKIALTLIVGFVPVPIAIGAWANLLLGGENSITVNGRLVLYLSDVIVVSTTLFVWPVVSSSIKSDLASFKVSKSKVHDERTISINSNPAMVPLSSVLTSIERFSILFRMLGGSGLLCIVLRITVPSFGLLAPYQIPLYMHLFVYVSQIGEAFTICHQRQVKWRSSRKTALTNIDKTSAKAKSSNNLFSDSEANG